MRKETATSSRVSDRRRSSQAAIQATARPTASPPTATPRKERAAREGETLPAARAPTARRNSTREEASFTRLSPSSTVTIRRGMGRRWRTEAAATASGGATTAPSAMAAAQGSSGRMSLITTATQAVVNSTQPTASSRMGRRLKRNSRQSVRQALAWRRGGRKKASASVGSSETRGRPGMKASAMPPITSTTA